MGRPAAYPRVPVELRDVGLQAVSRRVINLIPGLVDAALGVHRELTPLPSKDQAT